MAISWTPDLAVGVETIDAQHQQLFSIVDRLLEAMRQGKGRAETGRVLRFLESYVVEHFEAEERAMAEASYPSLAAHRAEHRAFLEQFGALKARHEATGPTITLVLEINTRVGGWLRNHVARTDRAFGAFLAAKSGAR
jgi:hemerythrin